MRLPTLCLVALLVNASCGPSKAEIAAVIDRAAPLVRAIRAYESDAGRPPASLNALVPKYLAAVPTTGLDASPSYDYTVRPGRPPRWDLMVHVAGFGFKHMRYDPRREYEIPVTELRDGWVMIDP